jgi:hypothetical protein
MIIVFYTIGDELCRKVKGVVGSRLGQIFHTRICMGCSALNSDLFRKNTVNSRRCTCGAIETPTHYLLNCPIH